MDAGHGNLGRLMRPFFSYYGAKWRGARHYGPPRRDLVIEPFAGSACYSVYWGAPRVRLYDTYDQVCIAWDWLIHCSPEDVRRVPLKFMSNEEWLALPDGPRQVVFWNTNYCRTQMGNCLPEWFLLYCRTGRPTGPLLNSRSANPSGEGSRRLVKANSVSTMRLWDARIRERIALQKARIAGWSIEQMSYENIPLEDAYWHVDPPYQGPPGRRYKHHQIDFDHLGKWCRNLPGAVDVCENVGADWLPFEPLYLSPTNNTTKKCTEMVWRNEPVDLIGLM